MNHKIMLVEAHDSFRKLLGIFLSRKFDVAAAKSGLEAMQLLRQGFLPSAILIDHQTADMAGFQLLPLLRNSGMFADIPVLILGVDSADKDDAYFYRLGAEMVLRKPFNPVKLEMKLNDLLGLTKPAPVSVLPKEAAPIGQFA